MEYERIKKGYETFGGENGRFGVRGSGAGLLEDRLENNPNKHILFVGSVNCLRHKPYTEIGKIMRRRRASILCPSMSDFSSGKYVNQVVEAVAEISQELSCTEFLIVCGCQWVILSTDGDLIIDQLRDEYGITAVISEDDHLEFGDHA